MNKAILTLLGTSCGFVAGILLSSQINDVGKTFALAGAMTIPSVFVAHLVIDSRANELVKKAYKRATESGRELDRVQAEVTKVEAHNQSLIKVLESVKQQLGTCEAARVKVQAMYDAIAPVAITTENELIISRARISELTEEVEDLKLELEQWEAQFHSQLALHVDQKVKELRRGELLKIFNEHDALVRQASEIVHRFQNWSEAVSLKHEAKRQLIIDLSERYSQGIGETIEGFNQEKDGYLREIEALHERVAVLQAELSGGLTEPEFVDAKFNPDLDLGNAICRQIFYQAKIPLRFCNAYTSDDGITHLGFMTSKKADREAIAYRINSENKALAGTLGLYKIESVTASDVLEGVEIRARRSRPQALSEDAIYRIMERPQACTGVLRDAMNHRKGGKPTLRVMSGTGGGKSFSSYKIMIRQVKTKCIAV